MNDLPITNGPKPTLPQWAIENLYAHHMAIAAIYVQLNMLSIANIHTHTAMELKNGSPEIDKLAEQLALGWEMPNIGLTNCSFCGAMLMLNFEGQCKACGFQHVTYQSPDAEWRKL